MDITIVTFTIGIEVRIGNSVRVVKALSNKHHKIRLYKYTHITITDTDDNTVYVPIHMIKQWA